MHAHSNVSDGTQAPAVLVAAAKAAGLDVLALTDHDSTAGWAEASAAAVREGIAPVPGIEISCTTRGGSRGVLRIVARGVRTCLLLGLSVGRRVRAAQYTYLGA